MRIALIILCTLLLYTTVLPEQPRELHETVESTKEYRMMLVTAYNSTTDQCGNSNGITSSGTLATEGRTVASDDLAIGTRVTIGGHEYTVEDTFGGNYRNRIDIYMGSSETDVSRAMQFGRQWITVEIKEEQ